MVVVGESSPSGIGIPSADGSGACPLSFVRAAHTTWMGARVPSSSESYPAAPASAVATELQRMHSLACHLTAVC